MVLHVSKSSFSTEVEHISFPADADKVRYAMLGLEEFGGYDPAHMIRGEGSAEVLTGYVKRDDLFSEAGIQKLNSLAELVDAMPITSLKVFAGVNANLKMSIFAETKCNFSPVSTEVNTALIHQFTCRFEARQALIYQLVLGLTGENGKYNYSRAVHVYPPFFDITGSAKIYKIAPALTGPGGYFYAQNAGELHATIRWLEKMVRTLLKSISGLAKAMESYGPMDCEEAPIGAPGQELERNCGYKFVTWQRDRDGTGVDDLQERIDLSNQKELEAAEQQADSGPGMEMAP